MFLRFYIEFGVSNKGTLSNSGHRKNGVCLEIIIIYLNSKHDIIKVKYIVHLCFIW